MEKIHQGWNDIISIMKYLSQKKCGKILITIASVWLRIWELAILFSLLSSIFENVHNKMSLKLKKKFQSLQSNLYPNEALFLVGHEHTIGVNGVPFTQCNPVALGVWELQAGRDDTCVPRPLWGLHPPPEQMPGAFSSQDCLVVVSSCFLWGHKPQSHWWVHVWHYKGEVTISSFLIWFWKRPMRGYVSHIHIP